MNKRETQAVHFNADKEYYLKYKQLMIGERTTPTADLNKYIKKRVDTALKLDENLLNQLTQAIEFKEIDKSIKVVIEELIQNKIDELKGQ